MLDSQVVADDSVDASAAVIELIIGQDDEDGVLSLLASYENGIAAEELKGIHRGLGEGDDAVVIVDGIGDPGIGQHPSRETELWRVLTSTGWASSSS